MNMSCYLSHTHTHIYICNYMYIYTHLYLHIRNTLTLIMLHKKKLGFTKWNKNMSLPSTQVTQFCHLNHLLKKVVRDHDDSSLGGAPWEHDCWAMLLQHMKRIWNNNNKQTCPYGISMNWSILKNCGTSPPCGIFYYAIKKYNVYIYM